MYFGGIKTAWKSLLNDMGILRGRLGSIETPLTSTKFWLQNSDFGDLVFETINTYRGV